MSINTSERRGRLAYDYDTGAEYVGISRRRLQRAVSRGQCERTKVGGRVNFTREQLDCFVAAFSGFHRSTR